MYVKTQWVNNTTPINDTNLNKIEQGIYDNSLVVDAVTNTLNPTDTETYKTAEVTEGQITDVIGVNDIVIKGDTEQDGTPTPSAPVNINVVSGSNVINTSNKNLFIPTLTYKGRNIEARNCTVLLQKDEFIFEATGSDMYFGYIGATDTIFSNAYGVLYEVLNNKTIRFTLSNTIFNKNFIVKYDENKKILGYQQFNSNTGTITFANDVKYYSFRIGYGSAVAGTIYKTKVQVELGSTATTYEPHQGKELLLDLPVENLFDKNNITDGQFINADGTLSASANYVTTDFIPITPNTKYYLPKTSTRRLKYFNSNKQVLSSSDWDIANGNSAQVLTIPDNAYYVRFSIDKTQNDINTFQFEQGSKANAYTPYGTDPIELCKIGNYQDYFYKSGSKWYLKKYFKKKIFVGASDEGWVRSENGKFNNSSETDYMPNNQGAVWINTHFKTLINQDNSMWIGNAGFLNCWYSNASSLEDFKTWLASNNVTLYYLLNTATDTEITDTTLISQLEAIYNAPLYEKTNITQTNNDLPMVLDITACKDNINGIKAFIRK